MLLSPTSFQGLLGFLILALLFSTLHASMALTDSANTFSISNTENALAFDSATGKILFIKLIMDPDLGGLMLRVLRVLENQVNSDSSATASAVTVLNALNFKQPVDPMYSMESPDGCAFWTHLAFAFEPCVRKIIGGRINTFTLAQLGTTMRCLGLDVKTVYVGSDPDAFLCNMREDIQSQYLLIGNFNRLLLQDRPGEHFSPIVGFVEDYVLILDVAKYRGSPVFVPCSDLVQAMQAGDEKSGQPSRGYIAIRPHKHLIINDLVTRV